MNFLNLPNWEVGEVKESPTDYHVEATVAAGRWWGVCETCRGDRDRWPHVVRLCATCDGTGKRRGLKPLGGKQ